MLQIDPEDSRDWFQPLLDRVDALFAESGGAARGWPAPHPGREPRDEEYSRITDPDKYDILRDRIAAWSGALAGLGIATASETTSGRLVLEPIQPGGLMLAVTEETGRAANLFVRVDAVDEDGVAASLALVPDCGCDACDFGSDDLLEYLDSWILAVARGGVIHASGGRDSATRTLAGWQASNQGAREWLDEAADVPPGVRRWSGTPWQ